MAHAVALRNYSPAPVTNLGSYIAAAYALPVLDSKEERSLAVRYLAHGDLEAAHKLVTHNLRFVIQIARGYSGYGLSFADLIQEGNVGLMKAVKKFDPEFGVRLISFAVHWIRAEMHEFILKNWRIVKIATTKAQRKLFFNLRSMKKRLGWLNRSEVQEIASQLDVKPEDVVEMERRLGSQDVGFDLVSDDGEESACSPSVYLADESIADPATQAECDDWQVHCRTQLKRALSDLDERSREILKARWMSGHGKTTLRELSARHRVSIERVRQIEKQAIAKLKKKVGEEFQGVIQG